MHKLLRHSILALFTLLAVVGSFLLYSNWIENKASFGTLIVGLQSGYPPFEYMDEERKIVGFDIDMANIIAEKLGKTLVISDMEFDDVIPALQEGKIDLIISGMNITSNRLKEILMVPYHGDVASMNLIFWNTVPEGIYSIEDITKLPNASISVEAGSIPENYLSRFTSIRLRSFQGALGPLNDVKEGKSLASLVEQDVADYLKLQHPEIKTLRLNLPGAEGILGFGIGIKKSNQKLFKHVERIIYELSATGKLKQLEDKWFKTRSN